MAFKLYDRDKDGYITKAEMVKLSKNLTKDQVEKVHELNNLSEQNWGFARKPIREKFSAPSYQTKYAS